MLTTTSKTVFLVEEAVPGEQAHVIGRCGDEAIHVGEVFSRVCRYHPRKSLADFTTPPQFMESFPITLRVVAIQAYGRSLDELGPGMTGSLVLSGDGMTSIIPGVLLESALRARE